MPDANWNRDETQKPPVEAVPAEFAIRNLIQEMHRELGRYMELQAAFARWLVDHDVE